MTEVDEELPGQDAPRLRRGTRIALVLGVLVLITGAIAVGVRHDGDEHRAAPSTPVTTRRVPDPGPSTTASPCGEGGLGCRVSIGVPINVVTAVRTVFPGARVSGSYTITGRDRRLYVRRLSIVGDDRKITLVIGVSEHSARRYVVSRENMETVTRYESTARTDAQLLRVRIDVLDRQHRAGVDRDALDGLAHDPRLLALL